MLEQMSREVYQRYSEIEPRNENAAAPVALEHRDLPIATAPGSLGCRLRRTARV